jgi:(methylthio)acryloyl-CoA hydratase
MQESAHKLVTLESRGDIALVGLNRPQKRNAISDALIEALAQAVEEANSQARAAIVFGHGTHFSAGLDLAEHVGRGMLQGMANTRRWHEVFGRIEQAPIPWIAAIHGAAIGGGLELAASAHIRVADEKAYFALPEGQRGIFVGGGGSVRIGRLIGAARMMDMMLTGRSISVPEGERWNLVQYVAREGGSLEKALELAEGIATNAPFSNYAIINVLPRMSDISRADGLFLESAIAAIASDTPEAKRRLREFLDKKVGKVAPPGE